MADVKWIKITTGMFEDEKIDFISSLPEADAILIIWIRLLTLAGKCNAGGYIYLTEKIPYTEEMLAHKFKKSINIIKLALETFKRLDMVDLDEQGIYLVNWEKHQNTKGLEKIREQTKDRVARHRAKQKEIQAPALEEMGVTHDVTEDVTLRNATDIDIDIDIDKELDIDKDKNIIILQEDEAQFLKELKKIKNYPLDREKDLDMFNRLSERYPQLDLVESIKDWAIYKQDKPLKTKDNPRSQINTSFKKYMEWGKNLKGGGKDGNKQPADEKGSGAIEFDKSKFLATGGTGEPGDYGDLI